MTVDPDAYPRAHCSTRTHRLIPSRYPPIGAFDDVSSSEDLDAVMALEGWTNDRLVAHRLARLPEQERIHGVANASVILAAFLHADAVRGGRFSSVDLGAWYSAEAIETAFAEVLTGLRAEIAASALTEKTEQYREYRATLLEPHIDIRRSSGTPLEPRLYDPHSYAVSQPFGEEVRTGGHAGIVYDSVRDPAGTNWATLRPSCVFDVEQARHFRATVRPSGRVIVEMMGST